GEPGDFTDRLTEKKPGNKRRQQTIQRGEKGGTRSAGIFQRYRNRKESQAQPASNQDTPLDQRLAHVFPRQDEDADSRWQQCNHLKKRENNWLDAPERFF